MHVCANSMDVSVYVCVCICVIVYVSLAKILIIVANWLNEPQRADFRLQNSVLVVFIAVIEL